MTPSRVVADDDAGARARAVEALLHEAAAAGQSVVRVGNPLRSPLTLDRILMQVAPPDTAPAGPQALADAIAHTPGREEGVLLLVEDADTLHLSALRALATLAAAQPTKARPALHMALVGRGSLRAALDADEFAPLRPAVADATTPAVPSKPVAALRTAPPPPVPQVAPAPAPAGRPAVRSPARPLAAPPRPEPAQHARAPRRGLWLLQAGVAVVLLCGLGIGAVQAVRGVFYRPAAPRAMLANVPAAPPPQPAPAPAPAPAQTPLAPPAPPAASATAALPPLLPALPPPAAPATPTPDPPPAPEPPPLPVVITPPAAPPAAAPTPLDQTARLRREFETFLGRSGRSTAGMSEAERATLFEEYLQWRAQTPGNAARTAVPRIVLHVPAGSVAARGLSAQVQGTLRSRASVETRVVSDGPARPTVLFFHRADEAAARQVADWMAGAGLAWTVQDMTAIEPRPAQGTLEAWLPDR